jgi:tetratricopeptide (TPR) repeat protein
VAPLTQRKLTYAASIAGGLILVPGAVLLLTGGAPELHHLALAAVLCLVPGRVNGWLWRDLYRSRRLLELGRFQEAEQASTRAIAAFRARPWLLHLRWLVGMVNTRHPDATAFNNRAAARIALGDLDRAGADLYTAVTIDPTYALAHANLAGLLHATGDELGAASHRAQAVALGLRQDQLERTFAQMGSALAAFEGQ